MNATDTLKIGSEAKNQPLRARIGRILRQSCPPIPSLDRLIAEHQKFAARAKAQADTAAHLQAVVNRLCARAAAERWSLRELARRVGVNWTAFYRITKGHAIARWIPHLESSAERLNP